MESSLNNLNNLVHDKFLIYQGSVEQKSIIYSNIILPTTSFLEKKNIYMTQENIFITTEKTNKFFKNTRNDYTIFIILLKFLNKVFPKIKSYYVIKCITKKKILSSINIKTINSSTIINLNVIESNIKNYFLNSNLLRLSLTMRKCSKTMFLHRNSYKFYNNINYNDLFIN